MCRPGPRQARGSLREQRLCTDKDVFGLVMHTSPLLFPMQQGLWRRGTPVLMRHTSNAIACAPPPRPPPPPPPPIELLYHAAHLQWDQSRHQRACPAGPLQSAAACSPQPRLPPAPGAAGRKDQGGVRDQQQCCSSGVNRACVGGLVLLPRWRGDARRSAGFSRHHKAATRGRLDTTKNGDYTRLHQEQTRTEQPGVTCLLHKRQVACGAGGGDVQPLGLCQWHRHAAHAAGASMDEHPLPRAQLQHLQGLRRAGRGQGHDRMQHAPPPLQLQGRQGLSKVGILRPVLCGCQVQIAARVVAMLGTPRTLPAPLPGMPW